MSDPAISVVIPHYNDLTNLERCLDLLSDQSLPAGQFEIIVADNNSRCGLAAVVAVCGDRARVVPAPIQGAGPARNEGVRASRGAYLAFVDSDCRPRSDWLERGLAAVKKKSQIIGGRVEVDVEDAERMTPVEAFEKVFAFDFKTYIEKKGFSGSGNLFTSREVFDKVGGFRSGVAEDYEWSRRATGLGFSLGYADDVIVSHPARRTWEELVGKWKRTTREGYLLMIETRWGRLRWFLRSIVVLLSPAIQVLRLFRTQKLERLRDRLAASWVLIRLRLWRFVESNRLLFG